MDNNIDYALIGKRIKEVRTENGMTMKELAKRLDVSPSTITRYERGEFGRYTTSNIGMIAQIFGVNPLWLEGRDSPKHLTKQVREFAEVANHFNSTHHQAMLSDRENDHVRVYRKLSNDGKTKVDTFTQKIYEEEQQTDDAIRKEFSEKVVARNTDLSINQIKKILDLIGSENEE